MFVNRMEAGKQLYLKLVQFLSKSGLANNSKIAVVALPRGGVPVAVELARKFACPLEILVAKKLSYPEQPEYAIGAVSSNGIVVVSPDIPQTPQWKEYIEQQRLSLLQKTVGMEKRFYDLAGRQRASFKDKLVILVDDGIATGMTALAALMSLKQEGASHVIMASPVMSKDSYQKLHEFCDAVVALRTPEDFNSVGEYYQDFEQTTNEEVIDSMRDSTHFLRRYDSHNLKNESFG
ncbi:MAG: hypothetical protein K2X27_19065 [Candidatus Obscuribacterales bacterium]|nr:hypothetical protein [Candidatus Obscuribacterales bacterium]